MNETHKENIGKAIPAAWEAIKEVAEHTGKNGGQNWRQLPWREIRHQLSSSGDTVDTTNVPPMWTSESPQMVELQAVLQQAGFQQQDHLFVWRPNADAL